MKKRNSIYVRLLKLLVAAVLISFAYFLLIHAVGSYVLDRFYSNSDYIENKDKKYIERLQLYVTTEHISSKDTKELNRWIYAQKIISIQVFKDDILMYDSDFPNEEKIWEEEVGKRLFGWNYYFPVTFEDGVCDVSIYGMYVYQFYNYAMIIELLMSVVVFLIIVIFGIRKTMNYIRILSSEIEILEGGNLDYPITIQGKDELTVLAKGLDNMRKSFRNQEVKKEKIVQVNQRMITEMSHDLRTPLTTVMIYTEILKNKKYKDEEQKLRYIDKISQKLSYMKELTDNLFEYSLISSEREVLMEKPLKYTEAFYDLMSESCGYLQQNGFRVQAKIEWKDCLVQINTDYVIRIFDNILSNIIKYADPVAEVEVYSMYREDGAGFCFKNKKKKIVRKENSTQIGIPNIVRMISQLQGSCEVKEENNNFFIYIFFKTCYNENSV